MPSDQPTKGRHESFLSADQTPFRNGEPMRVNVYAEEMTDRVEIVTKVGTPFTGLRLYLQLPVTVDGQQYRGPFMHRPGDDDSSAVTFWGKPSALREMLTNALKMLDAGKE